MELHIEDLAFGGDGVGRLDGKACFVPFTVPGDIVELRITESKRRFNRGEVLRLVEASEHRTGPVCPLFGECGGCSWQHVSYEKQLEAKRNHLSHLIRHRAKIDIDVLPVQASPKIYGWRRTARMAVIPPAAVGFRRRKRHSTVAVDRCPVLEDALNEELPRIKEEIAGFSAPLPAEVELSRLSGNRVYHRYLPNEEEIGFIQANGEVNELMKKEIGEYLQTLPAFLRDSEGRFPLLDIFCGDGNLSIDLGEEYRVWGYDASEVSIDRAKQEAERRHISDADYRTASFPQVLDSISENRRTFSAAILDPPRSGLAGEAGRIKELALPVLIYVSCIPSILARDLTELCAGGVYRVEELKCYDMFPQTPHIETVTILRRKEEV